MRAMMPYIRTDSRVKCPIGVHTHAKKYLHIVVSTEEARRGRCSWVIHFRLPKSEFRFVVTRLGTICIGILIRAPAIVIRSSLNAIEIYVRIVRILEHAAIATFTVPCKLDDKSSDRYNHYRQSSHFVDHCIWNYNWNLSGFILS